MSFVLSKFHHALFTLRSVLCIILYLFRLISCIYLSLPFPIHNNSSLVLLYLFYVCISVHHISVLPRFAYMILNIFGRWKGVSFEF